MDELKRLREENARLRSQLEEERKSKGHEGRGYEERGLDLDEYRRYGRQLIMDQIGIKGQLRLKKSKVLVIGAGGLGCPAIAYLAGAGVGTIGIVDNDTVDESNLHRQILHNSSTVGMSKAESAQQFIRSLNRHVKVELYKTRLTPINSFEIFQSNGGYDLVLDCTDTPATRYLVNDTAVLLNIPLVSASALKTEGQLSILNFKGGPCYRCLFPLPPPPDSVLSCGDGGILGPVVGIMGIMQSLEAIKVLTGAYDEEGKFSPSLTIFNAYGTPQWRHIRMRGKKSTCAACGDSPQISRESIENGSTDYVAFCGRPTVVAIDPSERISVEEYAQLRSSGQEHVLLDVREKSQFDICSLPGSVNVPYSKLRKDPLPDLKEPVYVCCRYGNDSQATVQYLKQELNLSKVFDIKGGLDKWAIDVDASFPRY